MMERTVIMGGKLVLSEGVVEADLAIEGSVVSQMGRRLRPKSGDHVIDASGKYVLPGLIDAHVHPQYEDDFQALSRAAAHGGITTLIHFVYVKEGMKVDEEVDKAIAEGGRGSHLDFALHASLQDIESQLDKVGDAISRGVTSFKMFMPFAKRGMGVSDKMLIAIMERIGNQGGMAMVHAEDVACEYLEEKFISEGKTSPEWYPRSRPNLFEADAVSRAIIFAEAVGCPLYLVHLSAKESLEHLSRARLAGQTVFGETCPHYLTLTDEVFGKLGALAKCAPPLRKEADVDAMWSAIKNYVIDVVASDHSGQKREKRLSPNVFDAPFGISATEAMFHLLLQEGVNKGRIDIQTLVRVMSENPAKIFGLYPRKGTLRVGADADLMILDPAKPHVIEAKTQYGNSDFSVWEGWRCQGKPVLTMQRGNVVQEDGVLKAKAGEGRFLPRGHQAKP